MFPHGVDDGASTAASASSENEPASTLKDHFAAALREFHRDFDQPSQADLERIWPDLKKHYRLPEERVKLYPLTTTTISAILGSRRQGLPQWPWVASFILACQLYAVRSRPGRRDQGLAILSHWNAIYAAHSAAGGGRSAAWKLTEAQRAFAAGYGPHSEVLITGAELGHPHARYRLALIMATSAEHSDDAASLLTDIAGTGHAPSLDLLDILLDNSRARDTTGTGPRPLPFHAQAARIAYELAGKAHDRGEGDEAYTLRRAAACGGVPQAVIEVATIQLNETDPQAAEWLNALLTTLTTPARGRHRAHGQ